MTILKKLSRKTRIPREAISVFNDIWDFVANIASVGVWLFAGAGAVVSGRGGSFVIDVDGMPFALRFVILAVIAAAMGWGLGAGVSWLTRDRSEKHMAVAIFLALIAGGLMVFSADWLAHDRSRLPEMELFVGIGLLVAFWVASYNFKTHAEGADEGVLAGRASALFTFSLAASLLLVLSLVGDM